MKKTKLYIMVGVAGSGKSFWLQSHVRAFDPSYAIISRDKIRFSMVKEDEPYFSKEPEVYKEFINQIKTSLVTNVETYVDATHLTERSRAQLIRALGKTLKEVEVNAIVIKTPLNKILEQNNRRVGREIVPEEQIRRMYSSFSIPTIEEGFDKIWVYNTTKSVVEYYEKGSE